MPPKANKQETVIFLVNIGLSNRDDTNNEKFVEKAKVVIQRLIEKKIFMRPNDLIGILVAGAKNRKSVEVFFDLQVACWEMVEKVLTLKSTDVYCNWVDALLETIKYMKANMPAHSKTSKVIPMRKIIMISDFKTDWNKTTHDHQDFENHLNSDDIQLLAIGKDELDEDSNSSQCSQNFLQNMMENISGRYVTLDFAASDLKFYKVPPKKPYPWYGTLEVTPSIKIPIVSYVKVKEETKFPSWKRARNDEKVVTGKQYLDKWKNSYTADEMTKGYKYGNEFHAVSKIHEENMQYLSGPRCYQVCGFTKTAYVALERWCRASTRVVLPSTDTVQAEFYCLVQAMANKNLAAVVRKVHNINMVPRMVALFPCVSSAVPWCLVEVALPYKEDSRMLTTRPMKGILKQATKEQNEAVDRFLDKLQLNASEAESEDAESFLPGSMANPTIQHKWHMLSHRALNPEKPLPPVDDYLKEAFKVSSIEEQCKEPLESIKSLFHMEQVVPKKKWQQKNGSQEEVPAKSDGDAKEETTKKEEPAMDDAVPDDLMVDMSDVDMDDLDTI